MASQDARALETFYDRYNRVAFTLVLRIVRTREDAEDVLVDVFWQAWQQAGRYDQSRGKPLAWLLTIARTRAIDAVRSHSSRRTEDLENQPETAAPAPSADPFVQADTREAVLQALNTLPEQQRVPLEMAYY